MKQKTIDTLGATIGVSLGLILGATGGLLWYFNRPASPPVVIQVEKA